MVHDVLQGGHNMEISKQDWALYRRKMAGMAGKLYGAFVQGICRNSNQR